MKLKDLKETLARGTDIAYFDKEGDFLESTENLDNKKVISVGLSEGMLEDSPFISVILNA